MPIFENEIGTTLEGMTNLESLTTPIPNPKPFYRQFSEVVATLGGGNYGRGYAQVDWVWNVLTREQRDQLRTFCAGASATVYIRTRTNDNSDAYKKFIAIMRFPNEEERDSRARLDFKIAFMHLVEIVEEEV
jgi:hypothetical protein